MVNAYELQQRPFFAQSQKASHSVFFFILHCSVGNICMSAQIFIKIVWVLKPTLPSPSLDNYYIEQAEFEALAFVSIYFFSG